jgi:hypothetical protein
MAYTQSEKEGCTDRVGPRSPRAPGEGVVEALVASVGIPPPSRATANAAALGNRSAGSFSRHIITARARSGGKSGQRSSTGTGFSDRCFTSIEGVLLATNGGCPHNIW